jgi:hypothetical protein
LIAKGLDTKIFKTKEFGAASFGLPCNFVLESWRMVHGGLNRLSRSRLYVTMTNLFSVENLFIVAFQDFLDIVGVTRNVCRPFPETAVTVDGSDPFV